MKKLFVKTILHENAGSETRKNKPVFYSIVTKR